MGRKKTPPRKKIKSTETLSISRYQYKGPLPDPNVLASFDSVNPNASRIILEDFQEQGRHRRSMEASMLKVAEKRELYGLIFGFLILMTLLGFGICLVYSQKNVGVGGWALIVSSLIIPIGYYMNNSKMPRINEASTREPEGQKKRSK
jgi:uncharacterized membrane protein